jgi:hypothetical protein
MELFSQDAARMANGNVTRAPEKEDLWMPVFTP